MRILHINSVLNYGSTGRIIEQLSLAAKSFGWESLIVHGAKYHRPSSLQELIVGNKTDLFLHEVYSLLCDRHGMGSRLATKRMIAQIDSYSPDVIHLHNLHGYYLNYPILFDYLSSVSTPIVWTLHDCWAFTGHCCYFDSVDCNKWQSGCNKCPGISTYPRSLFWDNSTNNYQTKKELFTSFGPRLTIVPVSRWLEQFVHQSFLKGVTTHVIHNGIDTNLFSPQETRELKSRLGVDGKKVVLGVALPWTPRKGLPEMIKLSKMLPADKYQVVVVGLSEDQCKHIPSNVIGIKRTNSPMELAEYYSMAHVFVNPTFEDNFPTTNIEALSCGTPVVTYRTGGSPEAIDDYTGFVVDPGDVSAIASAVKSIKKEDYEHHCRERAVELFDSSQCYKEYIRIYNHLLGI